MAKKRESLIDELVNLKFNKDDLKDKEKIIQYLSELYDELHATFSDEDDDEDENDVPDGMAHQIKGDDFPEDMIPFVVLKKKDTFVDYTCPFCNSTNKFLLRNFDRSQYKENTCPDCNKEFLLKGEFHPLIRSFVCPTQN